MNFSALRKSFSLNTSKTQCKPHQDLDIDETSYSVLRGEKLSINKFLSRDLSFGQSSRVYYHNTTNIGVPFQWEKKPGTPMINPPQEEVILQPTPPPSPPPPPSRPPPPPLPPPPLAMQTLVLPRPNIDMKASSLSWRFWFWRRRLSRKTRLQKYDRGGFRTKFRRTAKGNKVSSSDGDLDDELVGWIHHDSKSSSSSSTNISSSVCLSYEQFDSFRKVPFCCTTWIRYKSNNK